MSDIVIESNFDHRRKLPGVTRNSENKQCCPKTSTSAFHCIKLNSVYPI